MKLIAYNISNLTDARYYAAKGAHMIGFSATESTIDQVNAIKEWVDVPLFFVHLPSPLDPEVVWEWSERSGIQTFMVEHVSDHLKNLFPAVNWIAFAGQVENEIDDYSILFYQESDRLHWSKKVAEWNEDDCTRYLDVSNELTIQPEDKKIFAGVLLSGSEEDKIGVKSYDEIDDFLDKIEIEF